MPRKGVAKARGHVLYSVYYYCMSPRHYKQIQQLAAYKELTGFHLGPYEKLCSSYKARMV